jgi:hypothetical protein
MRIPRSTSIAAAVASVAAVGAVALVPSAGSAAGGDQQTLRFFSKDTSFVYTRADGTVVSPPPQESAPGDSFVTTSVAFRGTHRRHARRWTASSRVHCVFGPEGHPSCDGQTAIGGSVLAFRDLTIVGGAGRFEGATGESVLKEVPGGSDVVLRIRTP